MTTLYSCKHAGDEYRITKFDDDMNVVSSYLCNHLACDCPAGVRDTCRHRIMLPKFITRSMVDTNYFYDYDRDGWVQTDLGDSHAGRVDTTGTATGIDENWREVMRAATIEISDAACPKCGAAIDERFDCCVVHAATTKPFRRGL